MRCRQSEAEKGGLVDAHLLNGMLRVYTNSGRIEPALRFYDSEYKKHGVVSVPILRLVFAWQCDVFFSFSRCTSSMLFTSIDANCTQR